VAQDQQGLSQRELHAWQAFFQMQEVLRGRIERQLQACSGLSTADYAVLARLSEAPGGCLRAFELGAMLGWEKSRLHHQLTRMGKRGLVQRLAGDSRASHAKITAQGLAALAEAAPRHSQQVRDLVINRLSPGQIDQLAGISTAILTGLQQDQGTSDACRQ